MFFNDDEKRNDRIPTAADCITIHTNGKDARVYITYNPDGSIASIREEECFLGIF